MLPQGYSLDEYLSFLVSRWNTLIDPVAKSNLTEDIKLAGQGFSAHHAPLYAAIELYA